MGVNYKYKSIEDILKVASKYSTYKDFRVNNNAAYSQAWVKKIIDQVCTHMITKRIWNLTDLKTEALKYNSRAEFAKNSGGAYCCKLGVKYRKEICSHMGYGKTWINRNDI